MNRNNKNKLSELYCKNYEILFSVYINIIYVCAYYLKECII